MLARHSLERAARLSHRYAHEVGDLLLLCIPQSSTNTNAILAWLLQQPEVTPETIPTHEATEAADTEAATAPTADARSVADTACNVAQPAMISS